MHSFGHAFAHPLRLTLTATALVCAAALLQSVATREPREPSLPEVPTQLPRLPAQPSRSSPPTSVEPMAPPRPLAPDSTAPSTTNVPVVTTPAREPARRSDPATTHRQPAPARQKATRPADDVLVTYQRVGRELMKLQQQRGLATTMELRDEFRAIDLDALTTAEARADAARQLDNLRARIERLWGIELLQQCIDNPVGSGCVTE